LWKVKETHDESFFPDNFTACSSQPVDDGEEWSSYAAASEMINAKYQANNGAEGTCLERATALNGKSRVRYRAQSNHLEENV
jgi:hypothetical protein